MAVTSTIAEPVPLSDGDCEYWRSLDSWEIGEAIFLLQGYKVDQTHETVLDAAIRTHSEFYDRVRRAFLVNEIDHPEKTPAGNPCFYAKPVDWTDWAVDKGLLHDCWLDAEAGDLRPKQKGNASDRKLYREARAAYRELMEAEAGATAEKILTHLKSEPSRWPATAAYLVQAEEPAWERAVRRAGGIRRLKAEVRRNVKAKRNLKT